MKNLRLSVLVFGALAAGSILLSGAEKEKAPARATAEFVAPEKFTDFRQSNLDSDRERESLIERFTEHVADLGNRYIPEGQRLEIRFKDIDLAGDFEPWRGPSFDDIRILKEIYIPRMQLDYKLVDAKSGAVIREGSEKLSNMSYLMTMPRLPSNEPLRHDFELLTDWVRREFRKA